MTDAFRLTQTAAGRKPSSPRPPRSGPVDVVTVDRRVMREALRIARGDASLLVLRSRTTVEVKDGRYR